MRIRALHDDVTGTLTYVVWDPTTLDAVVIDPVLDYDPAAGRVFTDSLAKVEAALAELGVGLRHVLETHAHADHLSSAQLLKERFGVGVAIGSRITEVQQTFKPIFGLGDEVASDGSQFDRLLDDGEVLVAGSLHLKTIHTPGHTPACASYLVGDAAFTGDALFIEDFGTGRCDFPAGSAGDLYDSVMHRLYTLPDSTRVFPAHDYQPGGRELRWESTIGVEKQANKHIKATTTRDEYVGFRTTRDAQLPYPRLLLPSVRVNIDAGRLPAAKSDGRRYLELPLNAFHPDDLK